MNRLTALLLKLHDYTFDLKYQQGKKISVTNALSKLHNEANQGVHNAIPFNSSQQLNISHIYHN